MNDKNYNSMEEDLAFERTYNGGEDHTNARIDQHNTRDDQDNRRED